MPEQSSYWARRFDQARSGAEFYATLMDMIAEAQADQAADEAGERDE